MQKRDKAVRGRIEAATGKCRQGRGERISISSDVDYKPPRDYPEIRDEIARLNNEINHIGINVNQIAHRINSGIYQEEEENGIKYPVLEEEMSEEQIMVQLNRYGRKGSDSFRRAWTRKDIRYFF